MNDLATIVKMNKPLAVKKSQTLARYGNMALGNTPKKCSGRLPETEPKTKEAREFLKKNPKL